jgi:hypothetical protein
MSFNDQFICTQVRFKFWNGNKAYTVEYTPGLRMWFVFDEETRTDCLWKYELPKKAKPICTHSAARQWLDRYFESINSQYYTV